MLVDRRNGVFLGDSDDPFFSLRRDLDMNFLFTEFLLEVVEHRLKHFLLKGAVHDHFEDFWNFMRLLSTNDEKRNEYSFANGMMIDKNNIEYVNFLTSSSLGNIRSGFIAFSNSNKQSNDALNICKKNISGLEALKSKELNSLVSFL